MTNVLKCHKEKPESNAGSYCAPFGHCKCQRGRRRACRGKAKVLLLGANEPRGKTGQPASPNCGAQGSEKAESREVPGRRGLGRQHIHRDTLSTFHVPKTVLTARHPVPRRWCYPHF